MDTRLIHQQNPMHKTGKKKPISFASNSGVLRRVFLFLFLFSTYINHLPASFPGQLFKYADDIAHCRPLLGNEDFLDSSNNLFLIHNSSLLFDLISIWQDVLNVCLLLFDLLILLSLLSLTNRPLTKWDSVEYLGTTHDTNLRWSSHTFIA